MHSEINTFTFANPGLRANCPPASIGRDDTSGEITTTARHTIQLTNAIPLGCDERCPGKKNTLACLRPLATHSGNVQSCATSCLMAFNDIFMKINR